jgi:hypothetical protein
MPLITDCNDGFMRTMDAIKLLLGLDALSEQPFMVYSQFGFHGYTINLLQSHIDYLKDINSVLTPDLPGFDADAIDRWKLINNLLLDGFIVAPPDMNRITKQLPALAALAAFPTLEEVARRISGAWDEEGNSTREIPKTDGIVTWQSDGSFEVRSYKLSKLIVSLSHKLQLMHKSLDPRLQRTIASLDAVLQHPMVDGIDQLISPLYDRLQFFRDQWVHGRRYEGWEALLVSLLLALIYFGSMKFRLLADETT